MKKVAIIGAGPTGIYTFFSLLNNKTPLSIVIYEQNREAGVGMPYNNQENSRMMLSNIASIEIPPIFSTYIDWLKSQSEKHLAGYGVELSSLHSRQFLPRILLGEYFRDQFLKLIVEAKKQNFEVAVHESCLVTDLEARPEGVKLWAASEAVPEIFDLAVIATGHVWPDDEPSTSTFFPSPWSGLMEAKITACSVGVLGTSLSAIDAAMAVVLQHGEFVEIGDEPLQFKLDKGSEKLRIVLMSRSGILPEADFYCPIPHQPLSIVTEKAINTEIAAGSDGLLNRIFVLIVKELDQVDPVWCEQLALNTLDADSFTQAWFADRRKNDPFHWAQANLNEVERNKYHKRTVPWRYAILRLHEVVQEIVPHLNQQDRKRFDSGLARVFIDNYAAIPSQSIGRLLLLREAGIISIVELGSDYKMKVKESETVIFVQNKKYKFDIFIDARGQKPMKTQDLPFPSLRKQLESLGDDIPDVGDDYTLMEPVCARGRISFGALPYLMHDKPFVQGLTVCAEIGASMARAISRSASHSRRRLPLIDW